MNPSGSLPSRTAAASGAGEKRTSSPVGPASPAGQSEPSRPRRITTTRVQPIHVPEEWDDADLLTFEQFCNLIQTPPRTARDWRRRRVGPRWIKLEGCGRLLVTVGEVRRLLDAAIAGPPAASPPQPERRPA